MAEFIHLYNTNWAAYGEVGIPNHNQVSQEVLGTLSINTLFLGGRHPLPHLL
jgi:hypothetical protein